MAKILVTGMSGTGKSSVLGVLSARGHRTVDTDTDEWCRWVPAADEPAGRDWVWREERITALLQGHRAGTLFIAGCKSNQGTFYPLFDAVVLLSAPVDLLLERVRTRDTNDYGKHPAERSEILHNVATVEPLLRATSTAELDAAQPLDAVADQLEALALARPPAAL